MHSSGLYGRRLLGFHHANGLQHAGGDRPHPLSLIFGDKRERARRHRLRWQLARRLFAVLGAAAGLWFFIQLLGIAGCR
jgi:hypothetical protein